jgi:hypothetical protein
MESYTYCAYPISSNPIHVEFDYVPASDVLLVFKNGIYITDDPLDPDGYEILNNIGTEFDISKLSGTYVTTDNMSVLLIRDGILWKRLSKTISTTRTKTTTIPLSIQETDMLLLFQNGIYMEENIDYSRTGSSFTNIRGTWNSGTILTLVVIRPSNVVYKIGFTYGIASADNALQLPGFVDPSVDILLVFKNGLYVPYFADTSGAYTVREESGLFFLDLYSGMWLPTDLLNIVVLSYTNVEMNISNMSEQTYADIMKKGLFRPIARISRLREVDETIEESITAFVISGTYTESNGNGKRRSCNLVFENSEGQFVISEEQFWLHTKIKLEIGIKNGDDEIFFNKGIYYISNPEITSQLSDRTVNLKLEDKWSKLDGTLGGNMSSAYTVPVDTDLLATIQNILKPSGVGAIVLDYIQPILQEIPEPHHPAGPWEDLLPYTINKNDGDTYATLLLELAAINSYDIYYNENGNLTMERARADIVQGSSWDFSTDELSYMGGVRMFRFEDVFNRVVVIGDNVNGNIGRAVSSNEDIGSPTRISLIGEKAKIVTDSNIRTDSTAQIRADYELDKMKRLYDGITITCLPLLHLSCNDVVTIMDSALFTEQPDKVGRYIIQGISYDINCMNNATFTVWKANEDVHTTPEEGPELN